MSTYIYGRYSNKACSHQTKQFRGLFSNKKNAIIKSICDKNKLINTTKF